MPDRQTMPPRKTNTRLKCEMSANVTQPVSRSTSTAARCAAICWAPRLNEVLACNLITGQGVVLNFAACCPQGRTRRHACARRQNVRPGSNTNLGEKTRTLPVPRLCMPQSNRRHTRCSAQGAMHHTRGMHICNTTHPRQQNGSHPVQRAMGEEGMEPVEEPTGQEAIHMCVVQHMPRSDKTVKRREQAALSAHIHTQDRDVRTHPPTHQAELFFLFLHSRCNCTPQRPRLQPDGPHALNLGDRRMHTCRTSNKRRESVKQARQLREGPAAGYAGDTPSQLHNEATPCNTRHNNSPSASLT